MLAYKILTCKQLVGYFLDDTQSCANSQRMELLVIVIFLTVTGAQESDLDGPANTVSFVGSTVTLKCSSPSKNCIGIDWQKYIPGGSPLTIFKGPRTMLNTNVTDRDRYSVDNSSGCDVVIINVQLIDAGRFICSAIMNSSQVTKTAHLIILKTQPQCMTNASENNTAEGDGIQFRCEVTYNGANNASMAWKGVENASAAVNNGSYSVVATEPEVPSFTCETSFALETNGPHGDPIGGLATNSIPNVNCSTSVIKVLYSVRNVTLSPSLSNYSPGTVINCTARGHPSPTFKWQEMESGSIWTDIQNQNGSEFSTANVSSKQYRCVAMNVVRDKSYSNTSHEFLVNNTGSVVDVSDSTDTTTTTTNDPLQYIYYMMMAAAAGILLIIIVLIICFCNESCPGYKCCNSGKKSKDNLRDGQPLTENPDVCIYSNVNKGQDIHPKVKSPKRSKGAPQQPKASNTDAYLHEECTYADLAMEYGPRKTAPQNGQATQEETLYSAVGFA